MPHQPGRLEASNKHPRSRGDLLAGGCNTNNGRYAPSFVTGFQGRPHHLYIPCGIKREIQSTICDLHQVILDSFPFGELRGVHELGGTHLEGPVFLFGTDINGNDTGSINGGCCGDNPEADGAAPKDSDAGSLCMCMVNIRGVIQRGESGILIPACFVTAPQAVVIPQPRRQTLSSGAFLLTAATETSATTVYCENVEVPI